MRDTVGVTHSFFMFASMESLNLAYQGTLLYLYYIDWE